jgi:hypothetical protein
LGKRALRLEEKALEQAGTDEQGGKRAGYADLQKENENEIL